MRGVDSGIGGPFGAGIIRLGDDGSYHAVSIACNTVIRDNDPTAHAEMNVIRMASSKLTASFLMTVFCYDGQVLPDVPCSGVLGENSQNLLF